MKKEFRSFNEAREFVHQVGLRKQRDWKEYCISGKKPDDIPAHPDNTYKNKGWVNLGDWLGTGNIGNQNKKFVSFTDARKFVRTLNLKGRVEWREYRKSGKKPDDIPSNPNLIYKNKGWVNLGDWLGTGNISDRERTKNFLPFTDAKKFTHSLRLKSQTEWFEYCKSDNKPENMPIKPNQSYKNKGWKNWGDWLGTGRIADQNKEYRTFTDARKFVRTLKLRNKSEWEKYCKSGNKPNDIPVGAWNTYKKEWRSMGDWLGTGTIATQDRVYRSFGEAKKFIHSLGLKSLNEWQEYCASGKKPDDIPSAPWVVYKNWKNKKSKN